jgi:hypothetical protein
VLGSSKIKNIYLHREFVIYVFGKVCLSKWTVICQSQYLGLFVSLSIWAWCPSCNDNDMQCE